MATVTAKKVILKDQDGNTLIPFVEGMGVHEIGEVFHAPYTAKFTPKGAVPANGKEYRAGAYTDFWNNFVITGLVETCTYEEFDRQVREKGFCDVYAINTSTRTFKVPQIPDGLTLGSLAKVRGNGKTLGLTNGQVFVAPGAKDNWTINAEAFQQVGYNIPVTKDTSKFSNVNPAGQGIFGVTPDADKSGMVAELPVAQNQKWFCQLASGEINKADLDLNGLRADIANSANKDLSNVTAKLSDSFMEKIIPDYSAGITVPTPYSDSKFTIPIDGEYIFSGMPNRVNTDSFLYINGIKTSIVQNSSGSYNANRSSITARLKKGSIIYWDKAFDSSTVSSIFYPLKGAK